MAFPEGAPAKSAKHDDWVEFAIGRGVPSYEARNLTKDELVARFEQPDVVAPKGQKVDPDDVGPGHGDLYEKVHGGRNG